jgi:hypothetical protein
MKANEPVIFNYTGNTQSITLSPGRYKLECWGASGGIGNGNINPIGLGGYSIGILNVTETLTLYIYVGQDGVSNSMTSVRYNGGGAAVGTSGHNGGAGGGATDFRLINGAWNNADSLRSRILVAGGGGGAQPNCGNTATAGHGGGLIGGTSYNQGYQGRTASVAATRAYSTGGTQTSGGHGYNINDGQNSRIGTGSFGYGVNSVTCGAGGGGGWYGGGTGYTSGGGGGSSYAAGFPGCDTTYHHTYQQDIILEEVELLQAINTGNGYAQITLLGHNIKTINCEASPESYLSSDEEQYSIITIPETIKKDFTIYSFNRFIINPKTVLKNIDQTHYRLTIPAQADYDIEVNAIFDLASRNNSDIYKNVHENIIDLEILEFLKE